ncbi:MAG: ATP-grasp domain-containing protein [Acidobacteriota bacterium]|nr:ATP-grasp domain-containing protein [Blastocatellia bacterium]MDW8411587.1 ATP-grasp domain-containing protein [Acidobacteriota bacterium]
MTAQQPKTILCIASYEKGHEFMREAKRQGWRVFLLTSQSIADADWPRESLDDIFLIPDENKVWKMDDMIKGVSYLARRIEIDRVVALDDFDLEKAAALREHLRVPGMGDTTTRYFRDKLAMRVQAKDYGIRVPDFVHALNYAKIQQYLDTVPGPWMLKPRSEASSLGIKKINHAHEVWPVLEQLGDRQSYYVLERFIPGDVYHVDSIVSERKVVFAKAHRYGHPPFEVAHAGGIFTSRSLEHGCQLEQELLAENAKVLAAMGLVRGVAHTEFIKAYEDGQIYFVETAARVGGAHIVDLIEAAHGVNLWAEWAKIETSPDWSYQLPPIRNDYGGLIISLARYEKPDTSLYNDPEIVWRLNKPYHVGFVVRSSSLDRVEQLLKVYTERFLNDFYAFQPAPDRPTS